MILIEFVIALLIVRMAWHFMPFVVMLILLLWALGTINQVLTGTP